MSLSTNYRKRKPSTFIVSTSLKTDLSLPVPVPTARWAFHHRIHTTKNDTSTTITRKNMTIIMPLQKYHMGGSFAAPSHSEARSGQTAIINFIDDEVMGLNFQTDWKGKPKGIPSQKR
ncbi:hypothetical protein [Photorhabdus bodei]|uniref:Uncharacterized protein n=1 Tax=Photorhabdus bodei TaxID=2029681 RepID=A0AAW6BQG8_9GAMM|nr:hypothetical protein [Photorhabdus bodei]MDB6373857.1 hypothetical protein [Photorhabdus bodei]